jgi:hypothetical protein
MDGINMPGLLSRKNYGDLKEMIRNGERIPIKGLSDYGDSIDSVVVRLIKDGYHFTYDDVSEYRDDTCRIAWWMAYYRHLFSMEELLALSDQHYQEWNRTISINMVVRGHKVFTFDEIQRLGNPADRFGATLAHWQARCGHQFTVDELLLLKDARINYYSDDNYYVDTTRYIWLTMADIDEREIYRSFENLLHNGATVAHIMARESHRFTDEEIAILGDPKDDAGLSVSDWMKISKYKSSPRRERKTVFTKKEISNPAIINEIYESKLPIPWGQKIFIDSDIRLLTTTLCFIGVNIPLIFGIISHNFPGLTDDFMLAGIIIACLLIALSGIIQMIRREFPGPRVEISLKGTRAVVLGGLVCIISVGSALFLLFIRLKYLFK